MQVAKYALRAPYALKHAPSLKLTRCQTRCERGSAGIWRRSSCFEFIFVQFSLHCSALFIHPGSPSSASRSPCVAALSSFASLQKVSNFNQEQLLQCYCCWRRRRRWNCSRSLPSIAGGRLSSNKLRCSQIRSSWPVFLQIIQRKEQ